MDHTEVVSARQKRESRTMGSVVVPALGTLVVALSVTAFGCSSDSPTAPTGNASTVFDPGSKGLVIVFAESGDSRWADGRVAQRSQCHAPHRGERWIVRYGQPHGWRHQRDGATLIERPQLSLLDSPDHDVRLDQPRWRRSAAAVLGLL